MAEPHISIIIEYRVEPQNLRPFVFSPLAAWRSFQSLTAALIASSASTEQWIFTGGRLSSSTICVFLIA